MISRCRSGHTLYEMPTSTASPQLRARRLDAIHAVASHAVAAGYGNTTMVHGSASTGAGTYIASDWGLVTTSDMDLLVCGSLDPVDATKFGDELDALYAAVIGGASTPNALVSLKLRSQEFWHYTEARSLTRSAMLGGRSASEVRVSPRHAFSSENRIIAYPYALQYGLFRWARFAAAPGRSQVTALYELAKGLHRAHVRTGDASESVGVVVINDRDLASYTAMMLTRAETTLGRTVTGILSGWLRESLMEGRTVSAEGSETVQRMLSEFVASTMPHSLLLSRMNCELRRSKAA